ncbi:glucose-1-phosphate adenylyltransferase [Alkalihalobacillus pseudalcaliphilus]|uniref:glucose-1-phosphate adenylyltransferase n=1 Tax=Alkalihalobacillus pseudalcaliphilus TaxID=79884 RepID=UPI00064DD8B8|nr:glucose-1-phosphate adenylyltransferase [Alkalihalobacillus pseudalcaliphilus]KMK75650.1 glucose-1-phosphate adenylyltransferase [Alkalihalobacillus pseudalcaliphilus]
MSSNQTNCLALLLAGGEGKRLGVLTKKTAKPAVHFGGGYRIIDYTLNNCMHSGINHIGVLTQYLPLELHAHLGNGSAWNFPQNQGQLTSLPSYVHDDDNSTYLGTADAIYKNMSYIEHLNPTHLLVLSGDHIYQMDYRLLLDAHFKKQADATISVIHVPFIEAHRFGVMTATSEQKIIGFEEKPVHPKSNMASMGVYVFRWALLKEFLISDANDPQSNHDFGKDIIPKMLAAQKRLFTFPFKGYWKDVGTIESYWHAHMDIIDYTVKNPNAKTWNLTTNKPAQVSFIPDDHHAIQHSFIDNHAQTNGYIRRSYIYRDVRIDSRATIYQAIILPGASIGANVHLENVIVTEQTIIPANMKITGTPERILTVNHDFIHQLISQKRVSNA